MIPAIAPAAPRTRAPQAVDKAAAAFDEHMAEEAELERERQAIEALTLAFLKNEDAVMKKWIAMI